MNKLIKRMMSVFMAIVMVIVAFAPVTTKAETKSQTMYVGEAFEGHIFGTTITKVSSSNKKIVKAAKKKGQKYAYTLEAKKAGKATVTVTYKDYRSTKTYKLKITVKKADLTISAQPLDGGYALLKIKNNTKQVFDSVIYKYTFKAADGSIVKEEPTYRTYKVLAGKTAYETIYVGRDTQIDYSQFSYKIVALDRDPNYTYKNAKADEVVVKQKDVSEDGNYIKFKFNRKNNLNKSVAGVSYIIYYDAADQIIGLDRYTFSLSKKETTSSPEYSVYISQYSHPTYDHYEIVTQAYSYVTKK